MCVSARKRLADQRTFARVQRGQRERNGDLSGDVSGALLGLPVDRRVALHGHDLENYVVPCAHLGFRFKGVALHGHDVENHVIPCRPVQGS